MRPSISPSSGALGIFLALCLALPNFTHAQPLPDFDDPFPDDFTFTLAPGTTIAPGPHNTHCPTGTVIWVGEFPTSYSYITASNVQTSTISDCPVWQGRGVTTLACMLADWTEVITEYRSVTGGVTEFVPTATVTQSCTVGLSMGSRRCSYAGGCPNSRYLS